MHKVTYLAVFEPVDDGSYAVSFPDLPGCTSWGKTFEEAQREAVDALGLHVYGMEQDSEPLPLPSIPPHIDPDIASGYIVSPVTVFPRVVANEIDNSRVKTTVTIPKWVREVATKNGLNCSRLLEVAILEAANIPRPTHKT